SFKPPFWKFESEITPNGNPECPQALVVGVGATLNLFLWSAYSANKSRESIAQKPEHTQNDQDVMGSWDWFFTTIVNPQDTIAQWGMAILSLAAVFLLWETLKASRQTLAATQKMAVDSREIGEAQARAYLSVSNIEHANGFFEVTDVSDEKTKSVIVSIPIRIEFVNSGSSPARQVRAQFSGHASGFKIDGAAKNFGDIFSGREKRGCHLSVRDPAKVAPPAPGMDMYWPLEAIKINLEFVDVFGRKQTHSEFWTRRRKDSEFVRIHTNP
ncbi:MAG: hypothetical protein ACEPO2_08640, partial [Pelagibaca sp.]